MNHNTPGHKGPMIAFPLIAMCRAVTRDQGTAREPQGLGGFGGAGAEAGADFFGGVGAASAFPAGDYDSGRGDSD